MGNIFFSRKKSEPEEVSRMLRDLPHIQAPDDFEFKLQCRLESLRQSAPVSYKKEWYSFFQERKWVSASALVIVLAAALTVTFRYDNITTTVGKSPAASLPPQQKSENTISKSGMKLLPLKTSGNVAQKNEPGINHPAALKNILQTPISEYRKRLQEDIANIRNIRDNDVDKSLRRLPSSGNINRGYDDKQTVNFGNEASAGDGEASSQFNNDSARTMNDNK